MPKLYKVITYAQKLKVNFFFGVTEEWVEDVITNVLSEDLKDYLDRELRFGHTHFDISEIIIESSNFNVNKTPISEDSGYGHAPVR
jgi:hypothetical protein